MNVGAAISVHGRGSLSFLLTQLFHAGRIESHLLFDLLKTDGAMMLCTIAPVLNS